MLKQIKKWFSGADEFDKNKETNLLPLTPSLLADDALEKYSEEFNIVFSNPTIRNIALSGPYGSGKSTVIESWEQKNSSKKWLYVSLACFDKTKEEQKTSEELESALLNQLIYRIDLTKAPRTRFSRTKRRCRFIDAIMALSVVVFFVLSIWLWNAVPSLPVSDPCSRVDMIGAGAVWFLLAVVGCYRIIRKQLMGKFIKKLKLMNAELELSDPNDPSIFNKYMDDIVYLVNESNYDVIVFEDIDRFETVAPFERLRELNILANQSRGKRKKPLRFFYLVRDSLFKNASDRTKFFDFIIPVIPYADTTNSYDILRTGFEKYDVQPEPEFLYQLSLFIDNSRLIHDIINETSHYKTASFNETEDMSQRDMNRLLAMVSYKVIFPNDHEKLQIGQGYIYCLLRKKQESISRSVHQNEEKIEDLSKELQTIKDKNQFNEDELLLLYGAYAFNPGLQEAGVGDFNYNEPISASIDKLKILDNSTTWQTARSELNENEEYQDRLAEAKEEAIRRSEAIRQQIAGLKSESIRYERMTLADYLETISDTGPYFQLSQEDCEKGFLAVDEGKQVMDSPYFPLIRFVVLHGWIDESYSRYMSNFYAESLSPKDRDAIVSILQGSDIDPNYEFENTEEALRRLDENTLKRSCSRNYSIFRYLLQGSGKQKLLSFFTGLQQDKDGIFLLNYVCSAAFIEESFTGMERYLDEPIRKILENNSHPIELRRCFCHRFITAQNTSQAESLLKEIRDFAAKDNSFLNPTGVETSELESALDLINYQAINLDIDKCDESLLAHIYSKGMFAPDATLLSDIRSAVVTDDKTANMFTLLHHICDGSESGAITSIEGDPDLFVSTYLDINKNVVHELEDEVIWVLNIDGLSDENGLAYINALDNCRVTVLSAIRKGKFQQALLDKNAVLCSTENILGYFSSNESILDEHLASFFETNLIPEDMTYDALESFDPPATRLFNMMISSSLVSNAKLEEFFLNCKASYEKFTMDNLECDRINILIKFKTIKLTQHNLEFVRTHYPDCVIYFAKTNIAEYTALVTDTVDDEENLFLFSTEEVQELLDDDSISDECKIELIDYCDELSMSKKYSSAVNSIIAKEHFNLEDIELLPEFYEQGNERLQEAIVDRIVAKRGEIMQRGIQLPSDAVRASLSKMNTERGDKLIFIARQLDTQKPKHVSRDNLKSWFDAANLPEYVKLTEGPMAKILYTTEDNTLLHSMDRHSMIGKHEDNFGKPDKNGERRVRSLGYPRRRN